MAALLATALTTASPAGSQDPFLAEIGTLEFSANGSAGDRVDFIDSSTSTATAGEAFATNNRAKLSEVGPDDLVTLSTPGAGNQRYVGLKDHLFGIRDQGEGNGTPAAQINGSQQLIISLDGADLPGDGASFAQFGLKLKFGATVRIEAFDATGTMVAATQATCEGGTAGDCGSDSGADRQTVRVPTTGAVTTPFDRVVISIASPGDGAASLLDQPNFETYFNIVEDFDGVLACDGDPAFQTDDSGFSSAFRRLNVDENGAAAGCTEEPLKPYNDDIVDNGSGTRRIQFEPDSAVQAIYRGDLTFPAGSGEAFLASLEYDADGNGGIFDFADMDTCGIRNATPAESAHFPELIGLGSGGSDGFPTMPAGETSCVIAYASVIGGEEHWVIRVDADPWYR